jgi:glyoxylase-like metal-dependent hydrolase (beta-lactamase superfamily II)
MEKHNMTVSGSQEKRFRLKPEGADFIADSWMNLLREKDLSKKIYPENPFVEVYQLRQNLYGLLSTMLDVENGLVWMYLIIGPEKALLIDTSFGHGNLKALIERLAPGKEILLTNTHCSCDHSYGNCQFDKSYVHQDLVDDLNWKQDPGIWDYLFDANGKGIWADVCPADIIPFKKYEVVGVPDGYLFDLGDGYKVELIWLPGHQPGHSGFLDPQGRFLIAGDAMGGIGVSLSGGSNFYADLKHAKDNFQGSTIPSEDPRRTVTAYRDSLVRLSNRLDAFDYIFGGHGPNDFHCSVIPAIIVACDEIIANPDCYDYQRGDVLFKSVRGWGPIMYYRNGI